MPLTADKISQTINEWYSERLRGGPLAQNTEAYNQVFQAKADLVARLQALLPEVPAVAIASTKATRSEATLKD